jgi:hypothetical protein
METCMLRKLAFIVGALALCAFPALAQKDGPNGGMVGGAGGHQTELVVSSSELTVYLLDGGKVHDTKGSSFRAVVQQSGKTTTIPLIDQEGKRIVGKLDAPLEKGAIVVVTGKDHHGHRSSARYVIK